MLASFFLKDAIGPILAAVVSHMGIMQQLQLTSFHLVLTNEMELNINKSGGISG